MYKIKSIQRQFKGLSILSLVKCKECGTEISKKAAACPKCGAKRTTRLTKLVILAILIIFGYSYVLNSPSSQQISQTQKASNNTTIETTKEDKKPVVKPNWTQHEQSDKMTGDKSYFTYSKAVGPDKKLTYPFGDMDVQIWFGCNKNSEWTYLKFKDGPSIDDSKADFNDGSITFSTRIKWDTDLILEGFSYKMNGDTFFFDNSSDVIGKLIKHNNVLIEIPFSDLVGGTRYFEIPLTGSSSAIETTRSKCKRI